MARSAYLKSILIGGACAIALNTAAHAQTRQFDVPRGDLKVALDTYARQAGVELFYRIDDVRGRTSAGVEGEVDTVEALNRILVDSGLVATRDASGVLAIAPRPQSNAGESPQNAATTQIYDIVVTGSRIRGGASASPMLTVDAQAIKDEGYADLGDVIRSLPQNFSGGQNPGVLESGGTAANQNLTGGSGLNLRGIGPDASLTLLNGRRLSYSSLFQAVDVSAIPVEAVERIEILADGASAVYGSDAVAGVANVILKRDFHGLTLGTRHGGATDGGLATHEYTATGGAVWASGGFIATYKDASADPVYATQRAYTEAMTGPRTLYPGNDLRSGLLSLHQDLGDRVELRIDALHTERDSYRLGASTTTVTRIPAETNSTLVSPVLEARLPGDWSMSLGATWSKDVSDTWYEQTMVASGEKTRPVDESILNKSRSYDIGFEGPLFHSSGGDARLAIGAGYRTYSLEDRNRLMNLAVIQGEESNRFAYAELAVPLAGPATGLRGVDRLLVTAAVRGEDYDGFGGVTTPKFGLLYAPTADVTLKGSWGRSFKAPTLVQRFQAPYVFNMPASWAGGSGYAADAAVLMTWGGNEALEPERAKTWSATLDFHPRALRNFKAVLTWFDIDYRDRVVQPLASYWLAMGDERTATYILYSPTAAEIAATAASGTLLDQGGSGYAPDKIVAILFNRYTNAMRQRARGADLTASYRFELAKGNLVLRGSASRLDFSQQTSAGQPALDLSGTVFNPATFNGRIGAVWDRGGWTASAFVNHTSGVSAGSAIDAGDDGETGSFTTVDATVRYKTGPGTNLWSGIEIAVAAQNLFDRAPPLYTPATIASTAPYDSLNYSAVGRLVSISLAKHL